MVGTLCARDKRVSATKRWYNMGSDWLRIRASRVNYFRIVHIIPPSSSFSKKWNTTLDICTSNNERNSISQEGRPASHDVRARWDGQVNEERRVDKEGQIYRESETVGTVSLIQPIAVCAAIPRNTFARWDMRAAVANHRFLWTVGYRPVFVFGSVWEGLVPCVWSWQD